MSKRETWTIEPDADVKSLVSKAMNGIAGRKGRKRGLRTRLVNSALRHHFAHLRGKREGPLKETAIKPT